MKYTKDNIDGNQFLYFWKPYKTKNKITESCLSQWYMLDFLEDGITYKSCEHYMMAKKALLFDDQDMFTKIINSNHPKDAKRLGRMVSNFNSNIWDNNKYEIVLNGNLLKFRQNEEYKYYLTNTIPYNLVEASPYDKIWGIGLPPPKDKYDYYFIDEWKGENLLGFALMEVRDILIKESIIIV